MSYTAGDFIECLAVLNRNDQCGVLQQTIMAVSGERVLALDDIARITAANGGSEDGYGEWSGGFVGVTHDGRWFYLSGWCDTTGWG